MCEEPALARLGVTEPVTILAIMDQPSRNDTADDERAAPAEPDIRSTAARTAPEVNEAADERLWWMADALAWLPAWQGRWADAVRVQAWADDLVRQRGVLRGKLFGAVRQRFEERLAALPDAPRWQAALQQPHELDEAAVLALVFGPAG